MNRHSHKNSEQNKLYLKHQSYARHHNGGNKYSYIQKTQKPNKKPAAPKRKGIFPPNVIFETNKSVDMNRKDVYSKNVKCQIRTGAMYLMQLVSKFDAKKKANSLSLVCKPVIAILNQNSLTLQSSNSKGSIISSILLPKLERVVQQYKGTTCFDLIEKGKESKPIQVCTESKEEMDSWILSALEFKECLLKEKFELIDANANAFKARGPAGKNGKNGKRKGKGFGKGRGKGKDGKRGRNIVEHGDVASIDSLYYNNNYEPTPEAQEVASADKILNKILNDQRREEIAQRQIRRQVEDKIRKVKEAHKRIQEQKKLMVKKRALQKKKEVAAAAKKIEQKAKHDEKKILQNAVKAMKKMNNQDLQEFKVTISRPILQEQKRTKSEISRIMSVAENNQTLRPYDECLDPRLEGFKDKKYVKQVCQQMFGIDLCEVCEKKENFCNKCCEHRIGTQFAGKLADCKVHCSNLIS